jgi:AcrR family transcriptional regulator
MGMSESGKKQERGRATAGSRTVAKATRGDASVAAREDPRVRRTRALIVESFISLCAERGAGAARVSDIAKRAGINRATFYRHFEDIEDLQSRGFEGILEEIGNGADASYDAAGDDRESAVNRIRSVLTVLGGRREAFLTLINGAAGPAFLRRAEAYLEGYIRDRRVIHVPGRALSVPPEIVPRAISSLFFGMARWWLEHPGAMDARAMAEHYITMITRGVGAK